MAYIGKDEMHDEARYYAVQKKKTRVIRSLKSRKNNITVIIRSEGELHDEELIKAIKMAITGKNRHLDESQRYSVEIVCC